ncbi:MAG: Mrp/NBP35 family ATP-binding protein [Elusimicrobiaceae bacterium]|nr:Mrp/NBP35 family ATP-binding protein [Elusimicrobiaceae bacterium]
MAECTHDCKTCSQNCGDRTEPQSLLEKLNPHARVQKVIAVCSGKGGVGKSMVTALLASAAQKKGLQAAVLDADITGPSIPKMFGVHERAMGDQSGVYPVQSKSGVQLMSLNLLLDNENDPVIWRGPLITGTVKQFWTEVIWDNVDILFVDMPPGTGDVTLTVFQSLPIDGIVFVTSPQELVGMIVKKAVKMAELMKLPLTALVENMSYFICPDCGKQHEIFGKSHLQETADSYHIASTARLPLSPDIAAAADRGGIEGINLPQLNAVLEKIEQIKK